MKSAHRSLLILVCVLLATAGVRSQDAVKIGAQVGFVEHDAYVGATLARQDQIALDAPHVEIVIQSADHQHQVDVGGYHLFALPLSGRAPGKDRLAGEHGMSISSLMLENEKAHLAEAEVWRRIAEIAAAMDACIKRGCEREGILPGGLKVKRRAAALFRKLKSDQRGYWLDAAVPLALVARAPRQGE